MMSEPPADEPAVSIVPAFDNTLTREVANVMFAPSMSISPFDDTVNKSVRPIAAGISSVLPVCSVNSPVVAVSPTVNDPAVKRSVAPAVDVPTSSVPPPITAKSPLIVSAPPELEPLLVSVP